MEMNSVIIKCQCCNKETTDLKEVKNKFVCEDCLLEEELSYTETPEEKQLRLTEQHLNNLIF